EQTYQFIRKLAYRYQPHWDDPKLISYIRPTDVWDHLYSGKVLWNCAATVWAMWTPAMVYGGYAYDEHVENVKGHAEADFDWNNPQSEYFSMEFLDVFNVLLALKKYADLYSNLTAAYNNRGKLGNLSMVKAEYCLHLAVMNEYKTVYVFQIPGGREE
ncbi:MAG: hypothetical protein ACXQTV_00005, partial [Candidatus Hecatellaceae archaeon]